MKSKFWAGFEKRAEESRGPYEVPPLLAMTVPKGSPRLDALTEETDRTQYDDRRK